MYLYLCAPGLSHQQLVLRARQILVQRHGRPAQHRRHGVRVESSLRDSVEDELFVDDAASVLDQHGLDGLAKALHALRSNKRSHYKMQIHVCGSSFLGSWLSRALVRGFLPSSKARRSPSVSDGPDCQRWLASSSRSLGSPAWPPPRRSVLDSQSGSWRPSAAPSSGCRRTGSRWAPRTAAECRSSLRRCGISASRAARAPGRPPSWNPSRPWFESPRRTPTTRTLTRSTARKRNLSSRGATRVQRLRPTTHSWLRNATKKMFDFSLRSCLVSNETNRPRDERTFERTF